jgi:IclR family pca regulon transcriptional regulator
MTVEHPPDLVRGSAHSQSLERGLAILASFRPEQPRLGIRDLARQLGLTRSTTHRYVATLATLGYLQQDPSSRQYSLGPRALDLAFSAINSMELREISAPYLRELSGETGHPVSLTILDGTEVVFLERVRGLRQDQRALDLNLHIGSRLPAYCTSAGKVLLAFLPDDEQRRLLAQIELARLGPNTITTRAALMRELRTVRSEGIAVSNEELSYGLRSIAAPIRERSGGVVAAVSLAVHRTVASMEQLVAHFGPQLERAADEISTRVGHALAAGR